MLSDGIDEMPTVFDHIQMNQDTKASQETVQRQRNPMTTYRLLHRKVVQE